MPLAVFPGLRVYALCQRKWMAILVSFLGMACPVDLLVSDLIQHTPGSGCRLWVTDPGNPVGASILSARCMQVSTEDVDEGI